MSNSTITVTAASPATTDDCERARTAALSLLHDRRIDPLAAYRAFEAHTEHDADEPNGLAAAWIDASRAASVALTEGWANPAAEVDFDMIAWART